VVDPYKSNNQHFHSLQNYYHYYFHIQLNKFNRKILKKKKPIQLVIYSDHYDYYHDQIDLMLLIQVMLDHEQPLLHYPFLMIQYELKEDIN
jgi:hypothetical protein